MKKILDFCEVSGSSVKRYEGKRKYIATGDILDNKIISFEEVDYEHKPSRANQNAEIGDVIFAKMQNTKKVIIITKENVNNIYSTGFYVIKPKENVTSKFLFWLFNSKKFNYDKDKNCKGATQKAINYEGLNKIEIKILPTIQEQLEIINKLDKVQQIIDIRKEQIEILDKLIKSQFVEMFGDPIYNTKNFPIDEIGNFCFVTKLAGFEYSKYINYKKSGDVIMIRGLNVKNNKLKLDDVYYIDKKISDLLPRSKLSSGDICMTYIGINIGDVALVDDEANYHLAPNVAKISLNDKIKNNPLFFVNLLAYNKQNFASISTNTAKQALNMERIRKLKVMIPPIELQNKFAKFVKQIDKQKFEIQKSLEEIQKLQENLMYRYFG